MDDAGCEVEVGIGGTEILKKYNPTILSAT